MPYASYFTPSSVLLDLQAEDSDGILAALVDAMVAATPALEARREEILDALIAREAEGSTGSQGVGIPHVKLPDFNEVAVAIGIHQEGVDFAALDGELVHVFVAIVRPQDQAEEHLELMRWIAGVAQHQDFVSFARQAKTVEQVIDLLSELAPA